jgi:hypothetical protein
MMMQTRENQHRWTCHRNFTNALVADGWRTPDTYTECFESISDFSAVYMLLLVETEFFRKSMVAYVGMSTQLSRRLSGHPILRELSQTEHWPMRWFKPVPRSDLREVEAHYIRTLDPPWNLSGRRRGAFLP